jgi:G protein-coupled receptor 158
MSSHDEECLVYGVKVMKAAVWPMLEVVLMGALLLYSSVIVLYFEPSPVTCALGNWAREIGFVFMYGALVVKLYK